MASIETEDLADGDLSDLLRFDADRLRALIEAHHSATGSARAQALLDDWPRTLRAFVKVIAPEFRLALGEQAAEHPVLMAVG